MPEIVLQLSRVLFYLWRWGYIRSMALCGEDSAEIVEVYPFLPRIWDQSSVHTALHAMPEHCLAPGQGGRQWLKTINDGQHLGPSVCSCQRTHKKPPWTGAGSLPSEAIWCLGLLKAHFQLWLAGNFPTNFQANSCSLQDLSVLYRMSSVQPRLWGAFFWIPNIPGLGVLQTGESEICIWKVFSWAKKPWG